MTVLTKDYQETLLCFGVLTLLEHRFLQPTRP